MYCDMCSIVCACTHEHVKWSSLEFAWCPLKQLTWMAFRMYTCAAVSKSPAQTTQATASEYDEEEEEEEESEKGKEEDEAGKRTTGKKKSPQKKRATTTPTSASKKTASSKGRVACSCSTRGA